MTAGRSDSNVEDDSAGASVPTDTVGEPVDAEAQLTRILAYARNRDYRGWDLYDGESSRILRALPFENKWVNLAFQQVPRRAPVNVRPLLLVERRRNFMGVALFALANLAAYELSGVDACRDRAADLVDWLVDERSEGFAGYCGGHKHPLQGLDGRTYPNTPGVVGTSYAVKALLAADSYLDGSVDDELGDSYGAVARTAADFVFEDLEYEPCDTGARIKYKPTDPARYYTINANALGARLLVDLHGAGGDAELAEAAREILRYVVSNQESDGGWLYRDPPDESHLSKDNFHNGFVVESLLRYRAVTGDGRFDDAIDDGLAFYRTLFSEAGAPYFDEDSRYPHDVHSSAQGAVVFSMVGDFDAAERCLAWAVEHLSDGNGRFYQEKRRFWTKRTTFMRWCQAWMARGFSTYLLARRTGSPTVLPTPAE